MIMIVFNCRVTITLIGIIVHVLTALLLLLLLLLSCYAIIVINIVILIHKSLICKTNPNR